MRRLLLLLCPLAAATAQATPVQLVYQARVTDTQGTPISAPLDVTVALYSDATSTLVEPLWSEQVTVTAVDGYVRLTLGANPDTNPLQDSVFTGAPRYVSLSIDDNPLGERQLLGTVPSAVTARNVVGGTVQASTVRLGDDADTCPDGTHAGTLRWDSTNNAIEVCDGTEWRTVRVENPPVSCTEVKQRDLTAVSGVYTLYPGGGEGLDVWCDMSSRPKALLMRITGPGVRHATDNARYGAYPCTPSSSECKLSSADIDRFIDVPGVQVFEVDPQGGSFVSFFQRAGDDAQQWPRDLEASSRPTLASTNVTAWILTSYSSYDNAVAGVNGDTGDYIGANHHYPTPYASEQLFFKGSGTGMRANTSWTASCCYDNEPGYLWVY